VPTSRRSARTSRPPATDPPDRGQGASQAAERSATNPALAKFLGEDAAAPTSSDDDSSDDADAQPSVDQSYEETRKRILDLGRGARPAARRAIGPRSDDE
jgi:hypothetical protein